MAATQEYYRKYWKVNAEHRKEICSRYYYRRKSEPHFIEKQRERSRLYRLSHREEIRLKMKKYHRENIDRSRVLARAWREKNRGLLKTYFRTMGTRFSVGKCMAKKRGLVWEIPFSEFKELLSKRCHYCDGSLPETGCGLDRVDNLRGYVIGNVVPCCGFCNRMKGHLLTHDEMIVAMKAIREFRLSKILVK